ncbi:hypothetical protein EV183_005474 [Coemansia sp. RSA 2336]|nr:hypothetical protein EV183_005474 [Coemansia sp. RSA 2336]
MGLIKNNPKSIMVAWTGIIAIGFGTFVYAKDLVSNERRAENIRRIKRERRMQAYQEHQQNQESKIQGMEVTSVENKRKRQESIQGEEVLLEKEETREVEAEPEQDTEQPAEPEGSSPAKRPRTSDDGNEDDEPSSAEPASEEPKKPEPKETSKTPVFGMTFSSSRGLGGFASAAKGPSPLAKIASATATSGFAKYAKAQPPQSPTANSTEASTETPKETKKFEDMLTADGKQSLVTNAAMTTMVPAMAQTQVGEAESQPIRTYEEDETCIYSTKAKLFEFADNSWKERGSGQFKINRHNDNPLRRRLVMRMDQTFRLILNVRLFAAMKLSYERRFVRFTCIDPESAAPVTFALRFASESLAAEAHQQISDAIPEQDPVNPEEDKDSSDEACSEKEAESEGETSKGKAAEPAQDSDDEEEDEDYVASGSESGDNELDSDAVDSEGELNSDEEAPKATSSK